jgi:cell wall-associated NlpC family hydrolase
MSHADVGFRVPGGDAGAVADAARRYEIVGRGLEDLGGKVHGTAAALAGTWQGEAASSYRDTSSQVGTSFHAAARVATTTSAALRRYSAELERCQREGIISRHQAEHCLAEIETQTRLLSAAESDATAARAELSAAEHAGAVARGAGSLGGASAAAADHRAATARASLASAETREHSSREKLSRLRDELAQWHAKGRRAEEDAHAAAHRAAGVLGAQTVTPPLVVAAAGAASSAYPAATTTAATGSGPAVPGQAGELMGPAVPNEAAIGHSARARVEAMVRFADSVVGLPYIWGGGHGGWGPQPGYDCSGFVSAVLHAGGYLSQPVDTTSLVGQPGILAGPGHVVTIYDRALPSASGHVIISVNGQFYESGGSSGPWGGGGGVAKIGTPSAAYLSTFPNVLHPQGL